MKHILFALFAICIFSARGISEESSDPEEFVIGPEDILSIFVWHEPDLTNKVTVRPDGKIGLPLLNDVQASGLTPKRLQENITESLKRFLTTGPQVSVVVQEIRSQVIYITGAVAKTGVYPLGGPTTVMEALVRAGGIAEFAKAEEIQILRKSGDKPRRFRFNYKTFSDGKDYQQNIQLRNGDMVIVP